MFNNMVERLKKYTEKSGTNIKYKIYNKEEYFPLIVAIVTPLMIRVHSKVSASKREQFIINHLAYFNKSLFSSDIVDFLTSSLLRNSLKTYIYCKDLVFKNAYQILLTYYLYTHYIQYNPLALF